MSDRARDLRLLVGRHWGDSDRFLKRAQADLEKPQRVGFRALYASVPRRLAGAAPSTVEPSPELQQLTRPHWTLTDYVRAALVASAFERLLAAEQPAFLLQLFEAGEIGEQVSVLRTLPLLPEPDRFLETGLQACRTNARVVFEAIVCDNPFVAEHFPPPSFNQAVLKAIFMEVSARRIEGLERRITPELKRMAADYASERRAAGRAVPVDTDYIIHYGA
ncbi:MAG TPA: EboA domain-containing protein [Polyangiaceae bacterium]|nr:EboA domain-containing protein [Polyangiaceae bacterium]